MTDLSTFVPDTNISCESVLTAGQVCIPDGIYHAQIVHDELVSSKTSGTPMLVFNVEINKGEYVGTSFVERLNIGHPNETTRKIAYSTYGKICIACGFTTLQRDTSSLRKRVFAIEVKQKAQKDWVDQNGVNHAGGIKSEIVRYMAVVTTNQDNPLPFDASAATSAQIKADAAASAKKPWEN